MFIQGVRPHEPGFAGRVHLGLVVAVVVGNFALVEIIEDLDLTVTAKELLVGAERLGRSTKPFLDALPQADLFLDLFVGDQI